MSRRSRRIDVLNQNQVKHRSCKQSGFVDLVASQSQVADMPASGIHDARAGAGEASGTTSV